MTLPKEVLERINAASTDYAIGLQYNGARKWHCQDCFREGAIREAMRAERFKDVLKEIAKGREMGGAEGYLGGLAMKALAEDK